MQNNHNGESQQGYTSTHLPKPVNELGLDMADELYYALLIEEQRLYKPIGKGSRQGAKQALALFSRG